MNADLMQLLTRYRPAAKEYSKNALAVSHEMVNKLADSRKQVEAGSLSREVAIRNLRTAAGFALQRLTVQSQDMNQLSAQIHGVVTGTGRHNASDVIEGTKELLDIAQEVALETTATLRTIRANWEDYEAQMSTWVKDIQKGLK